MAVNKVNNDSFDSQVLQNTKTVLVDFYADWCGPCKMLAPVLEEVSANYPEVTFVKVNVDEEEDLARKFRIQVIPTLVFVKNGEVLKTTTGYMDADALSALIDSVK